MTIQSLTLSLLRGGVNLSSPLTWVNSGNALIYGLSDGNDAVTVSGPRYKGWCQWFKRCFHCLPLGILAWGRPTAMRSLAV